MSKTRKRGIPHEKNDPFPLTLGSVSSACLPQLDVSFGGARAVSKDDCLTVTTGQITREWRWTGNGLMTVALRDGTGACVATGCKPCDWDLGSFPAAKVVSLKAFRSTDSQFTAEHLAVEAEIDYGPMQLKYLIWAYPGAPGLRTQLWLKSSQPVRDLGMGISERLTVEQDPKHAIVWGYEAGLKADRSPYEILQKEPLEDRRAVALRNGLICQSERGGLILVKESHVHNHISKNGLETGDFRRAGNQFVVTGLGMKASDLEASYKFCWANWAIVFTGDEQNAQLALKQFDRFRYPVHPSRDVFIMANTWGSEDDPDQCCYKAREENVLREIEVCADLGIDLLQIDDGWQVREQGKDARPAWSPAATGPTRAYQGKSVPKLLDGTEMPENYALYPEGFGNVRDYARTCGIKLGLWHAWTTPPERIKANYNDGDFKAFKLDFAQLLEKSALDGLYHKGRDLVEDSGHTAVVNWDVTEPAARMGFYFGRDCGNLYLANRKAYTGRGAVLYRPWQVLRDAWELSDYMNLNKIQITYQNKDLTPDSSRKQTDAWRYTHGYNMAITLMASPIIFTETHLLSPEAREEIGPILKAYKAERDEMSHGYVFAIGDKPDNSSWTGFQNHNGETGVGYLTIFREIDSSSTSRKMALLFLAPGSELELTNVLNGESHRVILNDQRELETTISEVPGFRFLKYRVIGE